MAQCHVGGIRRAKLSRGNPLNMLNGFPQSEMRREILCAAPTKFGKMPSPKPVKAITASIPMRDFSRSLPMALLRARESVMRHFRPSLRAHGLTEQQWRILRALSSHGEIEVTELAVVAYL